MSDVGGRRLTNRNRRQSNRVSRRETTSVPVTIETWSVPPRSCAVAGSISAEVRLAEVRTDVAVVLTPRVPRIDSFLKLSDVLFRAERYVRVRDDDDRPPNQTNRDTRIETGGTGRLDFVLRRAGWGLGSCEMMRGLLRGPKRNGAGPRRDNGVVAWHWARHSDSAL